MGINSHGNMGSFPFPSCLIPSPVPIPTFYIILIPFPWDYHETHIPIGIWDSQSHAHL